MQSTTTQCNTKLHGAGVLRGQFQEAAKVVQGSLSLRSSFTYPLRRIYACEPSALEAVHAWHSGQDNAEDEEDEEEDRTAPEGNKR